jgi:hypothetical protein
LSDIQEIPASQSVRERLSEKMTGDFVLRNVEDRRHSLGVIDLIDLCHQTASYQAAREIDRPGSNILAPTLLIPAQPSGALFTVIAYLHFVNALSHLLGKLEWSAFCSLPERIPN